MYSSAQRNGAEARSADYANNINHSPVQTPSHAYPPIDTRHGRPRGSSYNSGPQSPQYYRSHPSSPSAARHPLPSPSVQARERPSSGYYDPVMDAGDRPSEYHPQVHPPSPGLTRTSLDRNDRYHEQNGYHREIAPPSYPNQTSPRDTHPHARAPPITTMNGNGPSSPTYHRGNSSTQAMSGPESKPQSVGYTVEGRESHKLKELQAPTRASNPMSVMNILSDTAPAQGPPPVPSSSPPRSVRKSSKVPSPTQTRVKAELAPQAPMQVPIAESGPLGHDMGPERNAEPIYHPPVPVAPPQYSPAQQPPLPPPSGPPGLTVKATEVAYAELERRELSDVEEPGFEAPREEWKQRSNKRALDVYSKESAKRKRRRIAQVTKLLSIFAASADASHEQYITAHEKEAEDDVRNQDIEAEKERKKDMQRKRRRERTLANETQKRDEAIQKLREIDDEDEKNKLMKDLQRHNKKVKTTTDLLQGNTPRKDLRSDSPGGPNLEGGLMTTFQANEAEPGKGKKGIKGYRPRKSKEQKLAEKENAAIGQAYLDRGEELPPIAPREEARLLSLRRDSSELQEATPVAAEPVVEPYTSKGYEQIYSQIWKDIAKKDIPKVVRIKASSLDTKQSNLRKTAQLASKEARRWQLKTNKSTKDVQARAKRSMREMLSFWKRNERDERDQRKVAERQELENARKAEAEREANRQKRKLNFLISQTELYSHFIGKKVKTDEMERSTDDVAATDQITRPGPPDAHTIDLPESNAKIGTKVTNFEDLDFDAEDETALREAAMANAQNAVKEAQDRARAFNNDGQLQSQFDDGEMNFQNPTSLQNMDVAQPKMLTCQLKEYQLKGLNWLVNLYEQGINGILADEMGLGKTVQSISVMSYLAEVHNIWGPFLVIAPASTLHNWQQEITKFVPSLKVLPYWGNAKDRKVLRKFWDRKHITYNRESSFHVLVTSYQLVVQDTAYFQKIKWQYMILDEAQAIKSSQSSRWKALLGFHCRNRLLLTGTPIQNNMQELWALLHFIMPSLFDSHDEFSEWFSKDIESHAQSNTKLNEDQLKRLHMILKPFMLRRVKKHVQKELGDKIEEDVFCDLTYRQRAIYTSLRNKISIMDLIEKAAVGDDQDTATLMNLVMQFRKVCNHPDLFERAEITSPMSCSYWAETASFMREGYNINVSYSVRSLIEYWLPERLGSGDGRLDLPGPGNVKAGWRNKWLGHMMNIWDPAYIQQSGNENGAFSWLRFIDDSAAGVSKDARNTLFERAVALRADAPKAAWQDVAYGRDENKPYTPAHALFNIVKPSSRRAVAQVTNEGCLHNLLNVSRTASERIGYDVIEPCAIPAASAPPIELVCPSQNALAEKDSAFFSIPMRRALYPVSLATELALLSAKVPPSKFPVTSMLPAPGSNKGRYTKIQVPSMRRFVTDSGKLAELDRLLKRLKEGGHRVLLYFQMTRMIDLMEEYLTYRNYKYCRLDGSTKLEDRRDTVAAFQSSPEIFVFLLSTRAGGLGINLTSADTVIFYDSDWNPTIDSQAMDRAHRLGQTRQVTVYRLITRGTIEERIRKRALQKEEVQRVVISGGAPGGGNVDFNARSRENRTKDIAMWLADDDQAAAIERKEAEIAEQEAREGPAKGKKKKAPAKKKEVSMDDMYHEGEGKFDDDTSNKPSGAATPVPVTDGPPAKKRKGVSKKAKTLKQRLALADGQVDGAIDM